MAEYDHNGNCVRDYIYVGNKLLAEYQPQTGKYYYYMNDQINSTRIVTDDAGNVAYSAIHGPFGGAQKTWTNTYDPKLKFSGKEREGYSDLDYFGARYYDHNSYRFISVDPIINKEEALTNPQLWNLYAYCANNPITFLDPDGRDIFKSIGNWWKSTPLNSFVKGDFKGGFNRFLRNLSEGLSDPNFLLGFSGGIKFKIKGFTKHGLNTAINRGVKPSDILDTLKNPLKVGKIKLDQFGRPSKRIFGKSAQVVINPKTKKIISVNPTSRKLLQKLTDIK
jgi:RHS repeat-associated protein